MNLIKRVYSYVRNENGQSHLVAVVGIAAAVALGIIAFQAFTPSIGQLSGSSLYRSVACAAGRCAAPVDSTLKAGPDGAETEIDIDGDGIVDVVAVDVDGDGRPDGFNPIGTTEIDGLAVTDENVLDEFGNIIGRNYLINGIPYTELAYTPTNVADILSLNGIDPRTATLAQLVALTATYDGVELETLDNGLITAANIDLDGDGIVDQTIAANNLLELFTANGIDPNTLTLSAADELADLTDAARGIAAADGTLVGYALDLDGDGVIDSTVAPSNLLDFLNVNGIDLDEADQFDTLLAIAEQYNIPGLAIETDADGAPIAATVDLNGDGENDAAITDPDRFETTGSGIPWNPDEVYDYADYLAENAFNADLARVFGNEEWRKNLQFIDSNEDGVIDFVAVDVDGDGKEDFVNPAQGNGFRFEDGGTAAIDTDGDGIPDRRFNNFIDPGDLADDLRKGYSFRDADEFDEDFKYTWDYGLNFGDPNKDVQLFSNGDGDDEFADYVLLDDATLDAASRNRIANNENYQYLEERYAVLESISERVENRLATMSDDDIQDAAERFSVNNRLGSSSGEESRYSFVSDDELEAQARQQLFVETAFATLTPAEIAQLGLGDDGELVEYTPPKEEGRYSFTREISAEDNLETTLYQLAKFFDGSSTGDTDRYFAIAKAANDGYVDENYAEKLADCTNADKGCKGIGRISLEATTNKDLLTKIDLGGGLPAIEQAIADDLERGPTQKDSGGFFSNLWKVVKPAVGIALDIWSGGWAGSLWRAGVGLVEGKGIGEVALGVASDFALQGLGSLTAGIDSGLLKTAVTELGREGISVLSDGEFDLKNAALGIAGSNLGSALSNGLNIDPGLGNSIGRNAVNTAAGEQSITDGLVNVGFDALGNQLGNAATNEREQALETALNTGAITQDAYIAQRDALAKIDGAIGGAVSAGGGLVNGDLSLDQFGAQVLGNGLGYGLVAATNDREILQQTPVEQPAEPQTTASTQVTLVIPGGDGDSANNADVSELDLNAAFQENGETEVVANVPDEAVVSAETSSNQSGLGSATVPLLAGEDWSVLGGDLDNPNPIVVDPTEAYERIDKVTAPYLDPVRNWLDAGSGVEGILPGLSEAYSYSLLLGEEDQQTWDTLIEPYEYSNGELVSYVGTTASLIAAPLNPAIAAGIDFASSAATLDPVGVAFSAVDLGDIARTRNLPDPSQVPTFNATSQFDRAEMLVPAGDIDGPTFNVTSQINQGGPGSQQPRAGTPSSSGGPTNNANRSGNSGFNDDTPSTDYADFDEPGGPLWVPTAAERTTDIVPFDPLTRNNTGNRISFDGDTVTVDVDSVTIPEGPPPTIPDGPRPLTGDTKPGFSVTGGVGVLNAGFAVDGNTGDIRATGGCIFACVISPDGIGTNILSFTPYVNLTRQRADLPPPVSLQASGNFFGYGYQRGATLNLDGFRWEKADPGDVIDQSVIDSRAAEVGGVVGAMPWGTPKIIFTIGGEFSIPTPLNIAPVSNFAYGSLESFLLNYGKADFTQLDGFNRLPNQLILDDIPSVPAPPGVASDRVQRVIPSSIADPSILIGPDGIPSPDLSRSPRQAIDELD